MLKLKQNCDHFTVLITWWWRFDEGAIRWRSNKSLAGNLRVSYADDSVIFLERYMLFSLLFGLQPCMFRLQSLQSPALTTEKKCVNVIVMSSLFCHSWAHLRPFICKGEPPSEMLLPLEKKKKKKDFCWGICVWCLWDLMQIGSFGSKV